MHAVIGRAIEFLPDFLRFRKTFKAGNDDDDKKENCKRLKIVPPA